MLKWAEEYDKGRALKYLPRNELDLARLPRQWIINVVFTLCGEDFEKWVKKTIKARNEGIMEQRDLLINMDPEMAQIFS